MNTFLLTSLPRRVQSSPGIIRQIPANRKPIVPSETPARNASSPRLCSRSISGVSDSGGGHFRLPCDAAAGCAMVAVDTSVKTSVATRRRVRSYMSLFLETGCSGLCQGQSGVVFCPTASPGQAEIRPESV